MTFLLLLLLIALISLLIQILTSKTVVLYLGWIVGTLLLQLKELITLSLKYMLRNIAVVFRKLMLIVEKRKRAKSFALLARGVGLIFGAYQFDNCVFAAKRRNVGPWCTLRLWAARRQVALVRSGHRLCAGSEGEPADPTEGKPPTQRRASQPTQPRASKPTQRRYRLGGAGESCSSVSSGLPAI